jgi:hypothetical protein
MMRITKNTASAVLTTICVVKKDSECDFLSAIVTRLSEEDAWSSVKNSTHTVTNKTNTATVHTAPLRARTRANCATPVSVDAPCGGLLSALRRIICLLVVSSNNSKQNPDTIETYDRDMPTKTAKNRNPKPITSSKYEDSRPYTRHKRIAFSIETR